MYSKHYADYQAQLEAKQEELRQVPGNDKVQQEIGALEGEAQRKRIELAEARGGYDQVKGKLEMAKKAAEFVIGVEEMAHAGETTGWPMTGSRTTAASGFACGAAKAAGRFVRPAVKRRCATVSSTPSTIG